MGMPAEIDVQYELDPGSDRLGALRAIGEWSESPERKKEGDYCFKEISDGRILLYSDREQNADWQCGKLFAFLKTIPQVREISSVKACYEDAGVWVRGDGD